MPIPTEIAQQMDERIAALEDLLQRAHGFIAVGPASELARDKILHEIAVALNWQPIDTKALLKRLEDYSSNQT